MILLFLPLLVRATVNVYEHDSPIAMIKQGSGHVINGHFKIIHKINLQEYDNAINKLKPVVKFEINKQGVLGPQLEHQLGKIEKMLNELRTPQRNRTKRAINWIGSAWKWIAGNPDATDWDSILKKSSTLVENNKQHHINSDSMEVTNRIIEDYNKILNQVDIGDTERFEQVIFNKQTLIKDEIEQIVIAYQLAKSNIVHTALLNKAEIAEIVSSTQTLPFANEIEALENATPSMLLKDCLLLYVVLLPETESIAYSNIAIRPLIHENKKLFLNFSNLLVSNEKRYGILGECKTIRDFVLCRQNDLEMLKPDQCISQVLDRKTAVCVYQYQEGPMVELISEGIILVTNFKGKLEYGNTTQILNGSFIINFSNTSIHLDNVVYSNWISITQEILPPILKSNLTEREISIDLNYLHKLHLNNVEKIGKYSLTNTVTNSTLLLIIIVGFGIICIKKLFFTQTFTLPIIEPIRINYPSPP